MGHTLIGHVNPRCARCRRTLLAIQRAPAGACTSLTLPFDGEPIEMAKAALPAPRKQIA